MGAYQNNEQASKKKRRSRGSVKNASRLDAFTGGNKTGAADWGGCDPARLQTAVVAITSLGGAITLGLSRNRGAYSLTLMLDDNRATMWYNGDADLDDELESVIQTLAATEE